MKAYYENTARAHTIAKKNSEEKQKPDCFNKTCRRLSILQLFPTNSVMILLHSPGFNCRKKHIKKVRSISRKILNKCGRVERRRKKFSRFSLNSAYLNADCNGNTSM